MRLAFARRFSSSFRVPVHDMLVFPEQPVHLTAEQVGELNRQLCAVRLDINHYLALIRTLLAQQSIQTGVRVR